MYINACAAPNCLHLRFSRYRDLANQHSLVPICRSWLPMLRAWETLSWASRCCAPQVLCQASARLSRLIFLIHNRIGFAVTVSPDLLW
jgi:hypothetical protein